MDDGYLDLRIAMRERIERGLSPVSFVLPCEDTWQTETPSDVRARVRREEAEARFEAQRLRDFDEHMNRMEIARQREADRAAYRASHPVEPSVHWSDRPQELVGENIAWSENEGWVVV